MQNSIKLNEADVQDLAPLVIEFACRHGSCHKEMDLLAKRFGVRPEETYLATSASINSRAYAFLDILNGTPKLLEMLDYILSKDFSVEKNDFSQYNKILMKYDFAIAIEENKFRLSHVPSGILGQERKAVTSWIEQHANAKTLSHLTDAKNHLGMGRSDYVLDDCRKAMEALTTGTGGFSDSLNELVKEGIILQGGRNRNMDAEAIRAIYGYCSTFRSHASAAGPRPDLEQAILGLHNAESCIYFLLRRLEMAKKNGKNLTYWA
jgi:hypothetical protein